MKLINMGTRKTTFLLPLKLLTVWNQLKTKPDTRKAGRINKLNDESSNVVQIYSKIL